MKKSNKNIMLKGGQWATTLEMEANYFGHLKPNFFVHITHIELNKKGASYKFEHLTSEKERFQSNINNILKDILKFYEGRGIKLSASNLRKVVLSLEELKEKEGK